jgi:hypothetical protein
MSKCTGGICSNSTLSWLGTNFQIDKNKDKIFMPYPWLKSDEFSKENMWDIYPDWTTIYDTVNNTII